MRNSVIGKLMQNNIFNRVSKKRRLTLNEQNKARKSVRFEDQIEPIPEKPVKPISNLNLDEEHKLSL